MGCLDLVGYSRLDLFLDDQLKIISMNVFIDPFELPSLHLSELKELPDCTAIYFAIDSKNRVLYVGQAINLLARWKNHHRKYQLEEIDKDFPVRIAWQVWNKESLNEAEKYLIKSFQPLLNGTEVKSPATVPSEFVLRNFLKSFSRRLIIIGFQPKTTYELPHIHLKYDWRDCSSKGTAAKIKNFIQENKDKNTSFKITRKPYGKIRGILFRPGSREQKQNARENRSYSNHWQMACNGVIIHVKPTDYYKDLKQRTDFKELAGIKMRAVTKLAFQEMDSRYYYEFSGLSCFSDDLVPLFWLS